MNRLRALLKKLPRLPLALTLGFAAALALLALPMTLSYINFQRQTRAADRIARTYEVIQALERVYNGVLEAESTQHAFSATGDALYDAPFDAALAAVPGQLETLRVLTADNPDQSARLAELRAKIEERLALTRRRVEERRRLGASAVGPQYFNAHGLELMTQVRAGIDAMEAEERRLLDGRKTAQSRTQVRSRLLQTVLGATSVLLLAGIFLRLLAETQRTARAEQEARAASGKLEVANEELRAFSYSVAHDLRVPLRAINSFSSILAAELGGKLDDPEVRDALDRIIRNGRRMNQLIDDLLALSRISALEIQPRRIEMNTLVREVCDELLTAGRADGRQIELQLPPDLPPAAGDPSLIRQVWVNLLDNAIKFSRDRNPARLEIGGAAAGLEFVNYFVRDNGAGFDMSHLERLFGSFQRLHRPDEFEGTGIGLALVKRIVQRHGGTVWAEGREGEGAFFAFTLPEWEGKDPA